MQSAAPLIALKQGWGQICYNYKLYSISSNEKFDLEGLFLGAIFLKFLDFSKVQHQRINQTYQVRKLGTNRQTQ